jgi:hypothetical protein
MVQKKEETLVVIPYWWDGTLDRYPPPHPPPTLLSFPPLLLLLFSSFFPAIIILLMFSSLLGTIHFQRPDALPYYPILEDFAPMPITLNPPSPELSCKWEKIEGRGEGRGEREGGLPSAWYCLILLLKCCHGF